MKSVILLCFWYHVMVRGNNSNVVLIPFLSGTLPAFDDVKRYMDGNPSKLEESWTSIKAMSPKTILWKDSIYQVKMPSVQVEGSEESNSGNSHQASKNMQRKRLEKSVFISRSGNLVGGGTDVVLNALAAYLRYLEGTARDDWQEYVMAFVHLVSVHTFSLFGYNLCLRWMLHIRLIWCLTTTVNFF